jgi:hypothetical protein
MRLNDWPTLRELIDSGEKKLQYLLLASSWVMSDCFTLGKRVIIFMDYKADQAHVPYVLDQFSQLWETPFSPTNRSFPCNHDRPTKLTDSQAIDSMYVTNHNLNAQLIRTLKIELLFPHMLLLLVTNGMNGYGSLGKAVSTCTGMNKLISCPYI